MRYVNNLCWTHAVLLVLGAIAGVMGVYGRFNGWAQDVHYPLLCFGLAMVWVVLFPTRKGSCMPFFRKRDVNRSSASAQKGRLSIKE